MTISVSGRIPIASFDGPRELECDRADITGRPLRAGSGELDIARQEWTYAKAIYAARDLALTSPTFQAALNPPASQDQSGLTPPADSGSPSELLTQAAERLGTGEAIHPGWGRAPALVRIWQERDAKLGLVCPGDGRTSFGQALTAWRSSLIASSVLAALS